jgi:hypothetical protein
MNLQETTKILAVVKAAWPNSYKGLTGNDLKAVVELWTMQFRDFDYEVVSMALNAIIATDITGYAPTIGKIKEQVYSLTQQHAGMTEMEAWDIVKKALNGASVDPSSVLWSDGQSDGRTSAERKFDALPEVCKKVVGSARQLADWAQMDPSTVNSVVASNFMRSYRDKLKTEKEMAMIPAEVRVRLQDMTRGLLT